MNEEQNTPETKSDKPVETGEASPTQPTPDNNTASEKDEYYSVDYDKKDVISTIGDGEMHDEGLVGTGETTTDLQSSMERLTDEQDAAESHDSEQ